MLICLPDHQLIKTAAFGWFRGQTTDRSQPHRGPEHFTAKCAGLEQRQPTLYGFQFRCHASCRNGMKALVTRNDWSPLPMI